MSDTHRSRTRTRTSLASRAPWALVCQVGAAALLVSACSGLASDAPTSATVEEFCETNAGAADSTAGDLAVALAGIGTPESISEDEREGFEVYVEALENEGATPNSEAELRVPETQKTNAEAYLVYVDELCTDYFASLAPTEPPTSGSPSR